MIPTLRRLPAAATSGASRARDSGGTCSFAGGGRSAKDFIAMPGRLMNGTCATCVGAAAPIATSSSTPASPEKRRMSSGLQPSATRRTRARSPGRKRTDRIASPKPCSGQATTVPASGAPSHLGVG